MIKLVSPLVISIQRANRVLSLCSIVYFDLGEGSDYLYHGRSEFVGVHTKDHLMLNTRDRESIKMVAPGM